MGGRPPIVGLLAVAVAMSLTSVIAAAPAAAQMVVPLPGSDAKPKVAPRNRYVRPTLPARNPNRVTAGISAAAVSPPQAQDSEASAVVGLTSAASVELELAHRAEPAATAVEVASLDEDAAPEPVSKAADAPPESGDSPDAPAEAAETEPEPVEQEQPAETASAAGEQAAGEAPTEAAATEEAPEPAAEETPGEAAGGEAVEAAEPGSAPEEPSAEVALLAPSPATQPEDEAPSAPAGAESVNAPEEAPDPTDPVELAEKIESESATPEAATLPEAESEPQLAEAPSAPLVTAAVPSHDASVEIEISPPPENVIVASATPEDGEPAPADQKDVQIAALTPPDAPAANPPAEAEDETPESTQLDTAPDVEAEAVEQEVEAEAVEQEAAPAEPESASDEAIAGPVMAEEPPAHPVVAAIRDKLAEPDLRKAAAASDLEALKAFYGTHEGPPLWITDTGFTEKAQEIIAEIGKADDWGLDAASFDLPSAGAAPDSPDAQAAGEIKLSIAILSYARDAQIGRLTPAKVSQLFDQRPSLRDPKTVLAEIAATRNGSDYLTSLHPQHEQFARLRQALLKARANAQANGAKPSNDRDVQLVVMNMERWRWMPRQMGNYYVWNNVPEFNVRVVKGGNPIYQEKTIVGQHKYATPFFSAAMHNVVFHPNWTVPPTIIKEDLAPKLQGPSGGGFFGTSKESILRRYGLEVSYKGERISADSVDWNNVNVHAYTFTQAPGPANVLGQFKFNFPNKHAIYMHDTPQRELFAETTRTLSHGCIRVNQPDRFAALLLGEDKGWSMAQIRSLVAKGPESPTVISLNRHVPVHLTYFTAVVDEDGRLNRLGDIYGIDNRMAGMLFDSPARFPVPATPAVAEAPSRDQGRAARRTGGLDGFISGLFGN